MAKFKTAKMRISVVEFTCPVCNCGLPEAQTGSYMFPVDERPFGDFLECRFCHLKLRVPAAAKRLQRDFKQTSPTCLGDDIP